MRFEPVVSRLEKVISDLDFFNASMCGIQRECNVVPPPRVGQLYFAEACSMLFTSVKANNSMFVGLATPYNDAP